MLRKIKYLLSSEKLWKKVLAYGLLICILFFLKDFSFIFILTFLFAYLFYSLARFISNYLRNKFLINRKWIKNLTSINFLVSILYILFILFIVYFVSNLVPLLIKELSNLANHLPLMESYINHITESLRQIQHTKEIVSNDLNKFMTEKNIKIVINIVNHIKYLSGEIIKWIITLVLSYFFVIDRKKLHKYLGWVKNSSLSFLYEEYAFLFKKIAKWFLLVFRAQTKIALVNTFLTWLGLHLISFIIWQQIPYLWLLILIVFIFSFVPVLGVIISSIPIVLIVYNIAGFIWFIYVVLMILIIHAIESYVLNPKFISEEVKLPVSLTFLILLIGEHLFWPIGLIISVPLFYIFIEIFRDFDKWISDDLKNLW